MLKYGPNNNYREVKKQLTTFLLTKYGWMSSIVERLEYYMPPEIVYDLKRVEEDRIYAKDVEVRVAARTSLMIKMEQSRPEVYGVFWAVLTPEGEEHVRRVRGFDMFDMAKDPLELWKAMSIVHETGSALSTDALMLASQARKNMAAIRQYAHESLAEHYQRYCAARKVFMQTGNQLGSTRSDGKTDEEAWAIEYMESLDSARYARFKCDLLNNRRGNPGSFPATMAEMYDRASGHLVVNDRSADGRIRTAFVTQADRVRSPARQTPGGRVGNARRGGRGGRGGQGGREAPKADKTQKKQANAA
jgi:hypothetical protein